MNHFEHEMMGLIGVHLEQPRQAQVEGEAVAEPQAAILLRAWNTLLAVIMSLLSR